MNTIVKIMMERDELSFAQAEAMLKGAREAVNEGENPEDVLLEWFGLEPDYIFDLIP